MNIKHPVNTQKVNILGNARLTIQYVRVLHLQNHSTHTPVSPPKWPSRRPFDDFLI